MSADRWEELRTSLRNAKSVRGMHEDAWRRYGMMFSSRASDGSSTMPQDVPRSQLAMSTVNIMVSAGQVAHPKILARARRQEEQGPSKIVEAFLDYWWDKYRVQKEVIRADFDSKIFGHGWIKTNWIYRERTKGRDLTPPPEKVDAMLADAQAYARALPGEVLPTREDIEKYLRQRMKQVAIDQPTIQRISPWDMWFDPQAMVFEQARWICQRYYRRVSDVKGDKTLSGKRKGVEGTAIESRPDETVPLRYQLPGDGAMLRAEMWEMWDLEDERLYIWSTGSDDLLFDDDWPFAVGHPFTFIPCFEVPENQYPMGVLELISPMIWEIDDLLQEQMLSRRRQRVMHLVRREDLTEDLKRAIESGVDRVVVPVQISAGRPLADVMYTIMPPPANAELYHQEDAMKGRLWQATGISEYQRGYASSERTATEVDSINQYSTARVRLMVDGVQAAMVDVARKLVGLAQQNLTRQDVVRLVGFKEYEEIIRVSPQSFMDGNEMVVPFTREDIAGEFDFKLEPGSALPDGEVARKQAALQLTQILLAMPETDHIALIKYLARSFGETDPDRFIAQQNPMMGGGSPGMPGQPQEGITTSAMPGLSTVQPRPGAGARPNPQQAMQAGRANR